MWDIFEEYMQGNYLINMIQLQLLNLLQYHLVDPRPLPKATKMLTLFNIKFAFFAPGDCKWIDFAQY